MDEPNTILWSKRSLRQLRKLPVNDAQVVYREADHLKRFPACENIKRLVNHACQYRLRIGRYRLLFDFDGEVKIISIEEVKLRDESTY
jgi:mRNA interferase RelE/StbE